MGCCLAEGCQGLLRITWGCKGLPRVARGPRGFSWEAKYQTYQTIPDLTFILCTLNGNTDATSGYALHLSINATLINVCTNCCSNVVTKSKQRNSKGVYKVQITCSNVSGNYNKFTTFIDTLKLSNKGGNQHHLDCSNDLCSSNKMPLGLQRFYNESLL